MFDPDRCRKTLQTMQQIYKTLMLFQVYSRNICFYADDPLLYCSFSESEEQMRVLRASELYVRKTVGKQLPVQIDGENDFHRC